MWQINWWHIDGSRVGNAGQAGCKACRGSHPTTHEAGGGSERRQQRGQLPGAPGRRLSCHVLRLHLGQLDIHLAGRLRKLPAQVVSALLHRLHAQARGPCAHIPTPRADPCTERSARGAAQRKSHPVLDFLGLARAAAAIKRAARSRLEAKTTACKLAAGHEHESAAPPLGAQAQRIHAHARRRPAHAEPRAAASCWHREPAVNYDGQPRAYMAAGHSGRAIHQ